MLWQGVVGDAGEAVREQLDAFALHGLQLRAEAVALAAPKQQLARLGGHAAERIREALFVVQDGLEEDGQLRTVAPVALRGAHDELLEALADRVRAPGLEVHQLGAALSHVEEQLLLGRRAPGCQRLRRVGADGRPLREAESAVQRLGLGVLVPGGGAVLRPGALAEQPLEARQGRRRAARRRTPGAEGVHDGPLEGLRRLSDGPDGGEVLLRAGAQRVGAEVGHVLVQAREVVVVVQRALAERGGVVVHVALVLEAHVQEAREVPEHVRLRVRFHHVVEEVLHEH